MPWNSSQWYIELRETCCQSHWLDKLFNLSISFINPLGTYNEISGVPANSYHWNHMDCICHIKCTKLWPVNTSLKSLGFPSIALREISFQYYSTIVHCLPFNDIKTCNQSSCILRFINSYNIGSTSIWFRKFSFQFHWAYIIFFLMKLNTWS